MSFVGVFVNKSFAISFSEMTVIQSWFLREGNVIFFGHDSFNGVYISFFLLDQFLNLCVSGV